MIISFCATIGRSARHLGRRTRYELTHHIRLRLWLLRTELAARGIAHAYHGGDGIAVYSDSQWFDVYPFIRHGRRLTWVVDHPHTDPDDEHPGWEIGWRNGFRFPVSALPQMWADFTGDNIKVEAK
ncbi:hypothetical protein ACIBG0_10555 [Nocardia sp. NPDC050630]|uniref:hypothetical protein n=1 Tax=Nocardia sp. NPDC050630 TaxID=3364321 RepID=UPI00378B0B97